jgi:hypothetical protein
MNRCLSYFGKSSCVGRGPISEMQSKNCFRAPELTDDGLRWSGRPRSRPLILVRRTNCPVESRARAMIAIPRIEADASVGPNAPATGAVFYASIGRSRNEAARRPFEVYGYASSTTVHQSFGHSVCDPHRRLLWSGRMFGIGFDIPSPTVAHFQSWPRRVQTAAENGEQTLSAAFQAGEPLRAGGLAGPSDRTGNNRSLARAGRRAARRSIHAGARAAAQHHPYT